MHIDPVTPRFAAADRTAGAPAAGGPDFRKLMGSDRVELSDGIPASPPPEVLAEVAAAAEVAAELRAAGRQLRFAQDGPTGRLVIEVQDMAGNVLRRIPPTEAMAIASGEARI